MTPGQATPPRDLGRGRAPNAILVARPLRDGDGQVVDAVIEFANESWRAAANSGGDDPTGARLLERFPSYADRLENVARALDTGQEFQVVSSLPGDPSRWFEVQFTPCAGTVIVVGREVTRERAIENAAREHEERFLSAMEVSETGMCLVSPEGRFLSVNPALCAMLGRDAETLKAATWQALTHADDLEVDLGLVADVLEGRIESYHLQKRFLRPDGSILWGDLAVACVRDSDRAVRYFISQIVDVSAAHAAGRALAATEAHYRAVTESANDAIITIREDGTILACNPSAGRLFGYTAEEAIDRPVSLIVPDGSAGAHAAGMARFHLDGERHLMGQTVEVTGRHRDGSDVPVELSLSEWRTADGHFATAILRDVAERGRTQETLRRSEAGLRDAQRIAHMGSWSWNAVADAATWSEEMFHVFGLEPRATTLTFAEQQRAYGPEAASRRRRDVERALATGDPYESEYDIVRPDGEVRRIVSRGEVVRGPDDSIVGLQGTATDVTAARRSRAALRASEEQFRALFHNAPLNSVVYRLIRDEAGEIVDWEIEDINAGGAAAVGLPQADLPGRRASELFGAEAMSGYIAISREVARTGRPRTWEEHFAYNDRVYLTSVFMAGDDLYANVSVDISELRRAQEGTRQSEERFRTMFEVAPLGIALIDTTTGSVYRANDRYLEIAGRTAEDLATFDWMAVTHPDDLDVELRQMARLRAGEIPSYLLEKRQFHPDGRTRWDLKAVAPMVVAGSEQPRFIAMVADITAQKEAEHALRVSRAELAEAQRVARVGSWSWDPVADVVEWSDELFRIYGLEPSAAAPSFAEQQQYFTVETAERLAVQIAAAMESREPFEAPMELVWPTGEHHHAIARVEVVPGAGGSAIRLRGTVADVTELRSAQALTDRALRLEMVSRLTGGIAHDFNNILVVINGYAEFLAEGLDADDPRRLDAEAIRSAAGRAAALTAALLAFGRGQILQPVVLDVQDAILGVAPLLASAMGDDVELEIRGGEPACRCRVDRSRLEQVVVNLALNARDAMPGGGRLTIETARAVIGAGDHRLRAPAVAGEYVRISVTDTGTGISRDTLPHIFEPFYTTKGIGAGTGLGLASVDGIVAQSGGFITVDSELGAGTTFSVFLPRTSMEPAATAPEGEVAIASRRRSALARGETILVVEDEPGVLVVTVRSLRDLGYTVLNAGDPTAAIALAEGKQAHFDLLVTDVVMPGMNGRQLADRLTAVRPGLPVLYTSGYAPEKVFGERLLDEGMPFLGKPFTRDQLSSSVRRLLDSRQSKARK
ncbi:MAG: PAS domain S-box protein, partial [Chloroflexota bacterium]